MALQGSLTLDSGISISSAYLVVLGIFSNYITDDNFVSINIAIFKDAASYAGGLPEVMSLCHKCVGTDFTTYFSEAILDDLGKTSLSQSYTWLRTLPAYSGMTEV